METITKKTVTNLTAESVSILTQEVVVTVETETHYKTETETQYKKEVQLQDGIEVEVETPVEVEVKIPYEVEVEKETQIGSNHRCAYSNTENGRAMLIANEPEDIVVEVLTAWGDIPTVEEPEIPEIEIKPTAEGRIVELEEQLVNTEITMIENYEAQEEINSQTENALIEIYEMMEE